MRAAPACRFTKTISQVLDDSIARNPHGDALVSRHQGLKLSYDLAERSPARGQGSASPGDRVGMWGRWLSHAIATAKIGAGW
jgi:fatty-acyl-CoA synthase